MDSLKQILQTFAAYGENKDGGICRTFGSEAYILASERLREYLQRHGVTSYIDPVGNVHGILGEGPKELIIASHLDTVRDGGKYDGLLGVAAGIECLLKCKEETMTPRYRLHVIATNGEEGNVLGGTFGSRCLLGKYTEYDRLSELPPITVSREEGHALCKEDIWKSRLNPENIVSYTELHIEQGNRLENQKKRIGIVTGIVGLQRYRIRIRGCSNHAGTTMMEYRQDALVTASHIICYCDECAVKYGKDLVATVSDVSISPNVLAVINGYVEMVLECRNLDEKCMQEYIEDVKEYCRSFSGVSMEQIVKKAPVVCNETFREDIRRICKNRNIEYLEMPSGATHDASIFGLEHPIGMIFIPSHLGISHSRDEWSSWEDCNTGSEVLYAYVREKLYGIKDSEKP